MKQQRASTRLCPVCRRSSQVLRVAPSGFWEQHVFARLSCFPFRCRTCERRFLRRVEIEPTPQPRSQAREEAGPVLVPAPVRPRADASREFRQLVEALREAEKARGLTGSEPGDS